MNPRKQITPSLTLSIFNLSLLIGILALFLGTAGCATTKCHNDDSSKCNDEKVRYRPTEEEAAFRGHLPGQPLVQAVREERAIQASLAPPQNAIAKAEIQYIQQFGPGSLLGEVNLLPVKQGGTFVGYRVDALSDSASHFLSRFEDPLLIGDVVKNVNGIAIKNPDDLMKIWDSLDKNDRVTIEVVRDYNEDGMLPHSLVWEIKP